VWLIIRDVKQPGDYYGAMLVGQGTATVRYTDTDLFAWYREPPLPPLRQNDNAYGFTAEGMLTTVSGATLKYSGHLRIVWDPQGDKHFNATGRRGRPQARAATR